MFFVVADHRMVRRTFAVLAASVLLAGCDAGDVLGFGTGDEEDRPSELVFAGCPGGGKETVTVGLTPEEAWGNRLGPTLEPPAPDANGRVAVDGFRVAVACEVAKRIHGDDVTVKWKVLNSRYDLEDAVTSGEIDLMSSISAPYAEHRTSMLLTRSYYVSGPAILVTAQSGLKDYDDLNKSGKKLCDMLVALAEDLPDDQFEIVKEHNTFVCLEKLAAGEVDGVHGDALELAEIAYGRDPQLKLLDMRKPIAQEMALQTRVVDYAMGVNPNVAGLRKKADQAMADVISDGTWEKLRKHYLDPVGYPAKQPLPPEG
jgi:ABC-type amino acid transport substrate-binding protein|uniref:Solute-binding protein family 3/N-terminal domain-containing protein n=1 Tax=Thermocrispum agreste TaxID=37925 RepID=A0A2W4L5B6_9PSEU|nr:MAG: hypothetical protein DIU77_11250 [Thermocrispum agreste]